MSVPTRLTSIGRVGLVGGIALFTAIVAYQGVREVVQTLASAGAGLLWVALFHLLPLLASTLGWYTLFGREARPSLGFFARARWIAESINQLLPALHLGGNFVRAHMLAGRTAGPSAAASVVVDITLHVLAQLAFTALGLALVVTRGAGGRLVGPVVAGLGVTAGTVVLFLVAQRHGIFGTMARGLGRIAGSAQWVAIAASAEGIDAAIRSFYRHRGRLGLSFCWHVASWLLGSGEIWLALHFLGHPVDLTTALVIEALGEAVRTVAFPVPGALGVQESGFLVLGSAFGLDPALSLALSLSKRVRELLLGVPGLIAWQVNGASALAARTVRHDRPRRA